MAIFAAVETSNGVAGLRDLTPADIPAIVDYWLLSPNEHLVYMGVDLQKLGTGDDIRKRFSDSIRTGDPAQPSISLAITLDDRLVGYTLFVRHSADVNYCHWHIIVPDLRAKGITTALYPQRMKAYFDIAPISRLIHQTRTRNLGVNRMLDKFFPVAETKIIDQPDGVGLPGEFHLRYVRREDIPRIFARAEELRASSAAQRRHATVEPAS
jgi:RimJ/RimL family protein N-acetyltransferase